MFKFYIIVNLLCILYFIIMWMTFKYVFLIDQCIFLNFIIVLFTSCLKLFKFLWLYGCVNLLMFLSWLGAFDVCNGTIFEVWLFIWSIYYFKTIFRFVIIFWIVLCFVCIQGPTENQLLLSRLTLVKYGEINK